MTVAAFFKTSIEEYINKILMYYNDMSNEEIKKSYNNIVMPKRKTKFSAGYDISCPIDITIQPNEVKLIPTGLTCKMQDDYYLELVIRSSIGIKKRINLVNQQGIIDADYFHNLDNEGHILIVIQNNNNKEVTIKSGERIVQGIFHRYYLAVEDEINEKRVGGIGSTNKK